MNNINFNSIVGAPRGEQLEYIPTLIPSKNLAYRIADFACRNGGAIIFGVRSLPKEKLSVEGLSSDFKVTAILQKALSLINPTPTIEHGYFNHNDKQLYGISVVKSEDPLTVDGLSFNGFIKTTTKYYGGSLPNIGPFNKTLAFLESEGGDGTSSKIKLVSHYSNIIRIYEPTLTVFFPYEIDVLTHIPEGKIFNRVMFSSCVDNFETYLSDLLHEIYIARPETLKSGESTVKVSEILECEDIEEFVKRFASKRVSRLQKGSIKGFIKDNQEISLLNAFQPDEIAEIERTLQIRHLYAHRNGIVDESFLLHFKGKYQLKTEHQLSIKEVLDKIEYLVKLVSEVDKKAVEKYSLSTIIS
ncbi:hypothetical protein ACE38W_17615 [Chitinophaga sp. Hz27]|uniref:hypothetical protein n=1 Tax=Chitinophaga sp. Hz27 TaxID=3347169 RepID=UPI0035E0C321